MKEIRRYFSYMGKYKGIYWTIFVITILASAGIKILYSYMNKLVFNAVEYRDWEVFVRAMILCVIVLVLNYFFPYLRYFEIRVVRKLVFDIKIALFHKLMRMEMKYYEKHHSGEGLKTLNWDANSLKDSYFSHVYWVVGRAVDGITAVITMMIYSPILALISVTFCTITVYISIKINQEIKKMDKKIQASLLKLAQRLSDILSGFPLLKMYSGSAIVIENYMQENEAATKEEIQRVNKSAVLEMVSFLMGILANFGTISAGVFLVAKGDLDYGTVMAVVSLQMSVSTMVQRFGSSLTTFSASLVKAGRVFDFLELHCEEKTDAEEWAEKKYDDAKFGRVSMVGHERDMLPIEVKKLCFSYDERSSVLHNFDMTVSNGEKILLMGESGCGKSTLLKLLLGFYHKTSGEIYIGGKEIGEYSLEQLRDMITYIPQNSYLFEGTIRENIAFGRNGGKDVNDAEIVRAAKLAYAEEFISELPQGYNTYMNAGGGNLSGGQRQRIAIARAFLKDSPIILMDEPASALDVQSERMINLAMRQLMDKRIVLMVTHRRTSFEEFDRVVEM